MFVVHYLRIRYQTGTLDCQNKEPIWKMLAALTVDIVTFMTVWSMSTILHYSILSLNKNNFKLQQKLKKKKSNMIILQSVFLKKFICLVCLTFFNKLCMHTYKHFSEFETFSCRQIQLMNPKFYNTSCS